MSEKDKPVGSSSGSSSALGSPSPDALDSASVRRLGEALVNMRNSVDDNTARLDAELRARDFRERTNQQALKLHAEKFDRLAEANARTVKLLRAVAGERSAEIQQAVKRLDETGKNLIQHDDFGRIEITRKGLRISAAWMHVGSFVRAVPLAIKALGLLAAGAGMAWAYIEKFVHHH